MGVVYSNAQTLSDKWELTLTGIHQGFFNLELTLVQYNWHTINIHFYIKMQCSDKLYLPCVVELYNYSPIIAVFLALKYNITGFGNWIHHFCEWIRHWQLNSSGWQLNLSPWLLNSSLWQLHSSQIRHNWIDRITSLFFTRWIIFAMESYTWGTKR